MLSLISGKSEPPPQSKILGGNKSASLNSVKASSNPEIQTRLSPDKTSRTFSVFSASSWPREYLIFKSSASGRLKLNSWLNLFVKARPPKANIFVPSTPPLRTTAISVVPPPTSIKIAENSGASSKPKQRATA